MDEGVTTVDLKGDNEAVTLDYWYFHTATQAVPL
jgi:hypothetical protein